MKFGKLEEVVESGVGFSGDGEGRVRIGGVEVREDIVSFVGRYGLD